MLKFNFTQYKPINVVVRTATPVDDFHYDTIVPTHVGTECVVVSNPLYVLFNEQRLRSLGQFPLEEWIASMNNQTSDALKDLRSKVSDEDLIGLMKSRYCQAPCELASWSAYLAEHIDKITSEAQAYAQAQQSQIEQGSKTEVQQKQSE